jgi:translation initiation factor IF-2
LAKRRVYELAKDYGMKGAEFVQVLKSLGFEKAKTHMAVLDDADQMVIEVRLQAAGYSSSGGVAADSSSPIRKTGPVKKKSLTKKSSDADEETAASSGPIKKKSLTKKSSKPSPIIKKKTLPTADEAEGQDEASSSEKALEAGTAAGGEPHGSAPEDASETAADAATPADPGQQDAAAAEMEASSASAEASSSAASDEAAASGSEAGESQQPAPDRPETGTVESSTSAEPSQDGASGSDSEGGSEGAAEGGAQGEAQPDDTGESQTQEAESNTVSETSTIEAPGAEELSQAEAPQTESAEAPASGRVPRPGREGDAAATSQAASPEAAKPGSGPGIGPESGDAVSESASAKQATENETDASKPVQGAPAQDAVAESAATDSQAAAGESSAEASAAKGAAPESGDAAAAEAAADKPKPDTIRRIPPPEQRAKILGRIELPKETIRDATRRSAPGGARNPSSVDSNLRRRAMDKFRTGGPAGGGGQRRGPGHPSGGRGFPGAFGRRSGGGGRRTGKLRKDPLAPPPGVDTDKLVQVEAPVTVKRLSEALGHKVQDLLIVLLRMGVTANINSFLDTEQVELVSLELNRNVEVVEERQAEDELMTALTEVSDTVSEEHRDTRPPIVTFMGHVDHGKTTLLDALRDSSVTRGEAGGITQHVGAYKIEMNDHRLVVLDTPGHAAFTAMRARGAHLTDIVVLIVAADDGVKPQTEEALNHAKAADVPVIVAINKIDKAGANPMQVKQQLSILGLQPEDWGGQTQYVEISALSGQGLEELVESISLEAEVLELEANPEKPAVGTVIEAKQTPAQGNVISVVVMEGTLRRGDLVLCGAGTGKVRVMHDDRGNPIDEALPGTPVEVLGLPELPSPGDKFHAVKDQKMAREAKSVADQRASQQRQKDLANKQKTRLEDIKEQLAAKKVEEVRLIIKADVMGSLEPIKTSLEELTTDEVRVRILHSQLGGITENDVALADASNALIVGFNSVPDENARKMADAAGVQVRFYNVIYELINDCRALMEGLLSPEQKEEVRGHAEIRRVFKSSKFGNIAGCFILDGKVARNNRARLVRDGKVVYSGKISGLRREKDDAREVREGFECGILLENYDDIKQGDIIEAYEIIEIKRYLGDRKEEEAKR